MDAKYREEMGMEDEVFEGKDKKHKIMTMEDVAHELKKDFAEEIMDSKKYLCMAKVAEKSHCEEDCHYLTEMAKDEYTHAYFIHEFMIEHDIHVHEEQKREFEELKERMKEFF
ncbi:MAG: hypothetical protein K2N51_15100 [Lachnospiraceae bacterium]|nr:hypothetical protein [Lachnospiraceae bacterium]